MCGLFPVKTALKSLQFTLFTPPIVRRRPRNLQTLVKLITSLPAMDGHGIPLASHGSTWTQTSLRSSEDISGAEVASPGRKPSWPESPGSANQLGSAGDQLGIIWGLGGDQLGISWGLMTILTVSPSRGLRSPIWRCRMPGPNLGRRLSSCTRDVCLLLMGQPHHPQLKVGLQ